MYKIVKIKQGQAFIQSELLSLLSKDEKFSEFHNIRLADYVVSPSGEFVKLRNGADELALVYTICQSLKIIPLLKFLNKFFKLVSN